MLTAHEKVVAVDQPEDFAHRTPTLFALTFASVAHAQGTMDFSGAHWNVQHVIECAELAGKVIRDCTVYDHGSDGAEVLIEFTDDAPFSVCPKTSASVEAKCIRAMPAA